MKFFLVDDHTKLFPNGESIMVPLLEFVSRIEFDVHVVCVFKEDWLFIRLGV